jgi:hypothetical protein
MHLGQTLRVTAWGAVLGSPRRSAPRPRPSRTTSRSRSPSAERLARAHAGRVPRARHALRGQAWGCMLADDLAEAQDTARKLHALTAAA